MAEKKTTQTKKKASPEPTEATGDATKESELPTQRTGLFVATGSFLAPGGRSIRKGDVVDADDPVIEGREHLFTPAEQAAQEYSEGLISDGTR